MKRLFTFVLLLCCATPAAAEMMTVQHLKDMIAKGGDGEAAAVGYIQGVVDGMLGMDALHQKERGTPREFCGFGGANAPRHPAYYTKQLVVAWEQQQRAMNTLAVDMALAYLSARHACPSESRQ